MKPVTPRHLIHVLEDLQTELTLWDRTAQETLEIANSQQRLMHEQADQSMRVARIVDDRATADLTKCEAVQLEADKLAANTHDAWLNAEALVSQAEQVATATQQVTHYWNTELGKAKEWLVRAQTRLQVAKAAFEAAQRQLGLAKYQLDDAIRRFNTCQNDANRRHCRNEAAAVQHTEGIVRAAIVAVELAQNEVNAALIEVQHATQRVSCCTQAVDTTKTALEIAALAQGAAKESLNQAERATEYSQTVSKATTKINQFASQQQQVAKQLLAEANAQSRLTEAAQSHLNTAESYYESARLLSQDAQGVLSDRIDQLNHYDRPEPL